MAEVGETGQMLKRDPLSTQITETGEFPHRLDGNGIVEESSTVETGRVDAPGVSEQVRSVIVGGENSRFVEQMCSGPQKIRDAPG